MIVREVRCGSSSDDAMFKFSNWICFRVLSVLVNRLTKQIEPRQNWMGFIHLAAKLPQILVPGRGPCTFCLYWCNVVIFVCFGAHLVLEFPRQPRLISAKGNCHRCQKKCVVSKGHLMGILWTYFLIILFQLDSITATHSTHRGWTCTDSSLGIPGPWPWESVHAGNMSMSHFILLISHF